MLIAILMSNFATADTYNTCAGVTELISINTPTIKVVTLNASHGRKRSINQLLVRRKRIHRNLDDIANLLQRTGADIVALQEADAPSRWSGGFDHVEYLLEKTDYDCFVHGHHAQNWLYSFGTALLSRSRVFELEAFDFAPSPPTTTKGFVKFTVNWSIGGNFVPLTVVSTHLDFLRDTVRDSQVTEIILALSDLDGPLIVMGDFNSEWSDDGSQVKQLMDALGLIAFEPGRAGLGTYKSSNGKRLDWILISHELQFVEYNVESDIVSDHSAVYAEIRYSGKHLD